MEERESWEDGEDEVVYEPKKGLNPNAASFSFNPSAPAFVPSFGGRPAAPAAAAPAAPAAPAPAAQRSVAVEAEANHATSTAGSGEASGGAPPAASSNVQSEKSVEDSDGQPPKPDAGDEASQLKSDMQDLKVSSSSSDAQAPSSREAGTNSDEPKAPAAEGPGKSAKDERIEDDNDDSDPREHLNIVFIGHVDAGKSTIGGQILFLTNMVDERTIQKYEREAKEKNRESWYMAYVMDTNEEERAKGKTVEVGRAQFETKVKRYTILDAPGHKNYVPNMIGGAAQADIAVLVIAARKGEFETGFERGGQTREHAQLAKTLGVAKLIVVVNKMDDPSVNWDKTRFDEVVTKLSPFLKSCGYNVKRDVLFVPISGLTGDNIRDHVSKEKCPWWDGEPTLFQILDTMDPIDRDPSAPFRMPVLDKYKDMGTCVMGKIEAGTVKRGESLLLMPNRKEVKVQTIMLETEEKNTAKVGENVRLRILGAEEDECSTGFVLSSSLSPNEPTVKFEAQLAVLELLEHKAIFTAGYKAVLHVHTLVEECEVVKLVHQIDPKTKQPMKKKAAFVKSGTLVTCHIMVEKPICVEPFSVNSQLGRFTLRDEGKTIAIGKVMRCKPYVAENVSAASS